MADRDLQTLSLAGRLLFDAEGEVSRTLLEDTAAHGDPPPARLAALRTRLTAATRAACEGWRREGEAVERLDAWLAGRWKR